MLTQKGLKILFFEICIFIIATNTARIYDNCLSVVSANRVSNTNVQLPAVTKTGSKSYSEDISKSVSRYIYTLASHACALYAMDHRAITASLN